MLMRTARARVAAKSVNPEYWLDIRSKARGSAFFKSASAKVVLDAYDPSKYLLTHCTIVASVDTEDTGLPTGKFMSNGVQIERLYSDFYVTENTEKYINNNRDCFERNLLLASYRTFIGAQNYSEHVQIPELSKGRVIDAAARDIGDSIYIDILVATERKHVELVQDISTGVMSTLSMGAQISFSICTFCGNVAYDEVQLCPHVKYAKGTKFVDAKGQQRVIAELCGHMSVPESVKFIEASWVGTPAFTGAVVRGVLEPGEAMAEAIKGKIIDTFQSTRVEDISKARRLAASLKSAQFGDQGQTQEAPSESPAEDTSLEAPSKELYKTLVKSVKDKVEEELAKQDQKKTEDIMDPNASNESLVKSALLQPKWQRRAKALLQKSGPTATRRVLAGLYLYEVAGIEAVARRRTFTGAELLGLVRMSDFFSRRASYAGEQRLTSTVISVGSLKKFASVDTYLTACAKEMGRNPNKIEKMHLLEKARIFSLGID